MRTEITGFAEISKWISANLSFNLLECGKEISTSFLAWWFELFITQEGAGFSHCCWQAHLRVRGKAAINELPHRDTRMNWLI